MASHSGPPPTCLNCGTALSGQYCGKCGQRAGSRLISLWELVRDAFGDLFELDSRLWRTLIPLLFRPGRLTNDYLQGKRARYMPPFRMYLVLSLVFFVIVFFDPRQQLAILYETDAAAVEIGAEQRAADNEEARAILEELVRDGVIDESVLGAGGALADEPTTTEDAEAAAAPEPPKLPAAGDDSGLNLTFNGDDASCEIGDASLDDAPGFIKRRFTVERLRHVCERVVEVGPYGVLRAVLDNMPVALLILLPFMALVLKILYPLSRRYYVEHLLFFVHFNAFLFLLLTLQVLWARLIAMLGLPGTISVLPIVATSFYVPVYLYKSMRRVYRQGSAITLLKNIILSIVYVIGLCIMLIGALLIAVFSV